MIKSSGGVRARMRLSICDGISLGWLVEAIEASHSLDVGPEVE